MCILHYSVISRLIFHLSISFMPPDPFRHPLSFNRPPPTTFPRHPILSSLHSPPHPAPIQHSFPLPFHSQPLSTHPTWYPIPNRFFSLVNLHPAFSFNHQPKTPHSSPSSCPPSAWVPLLLSLHTLHRPSVPTPRVTNSAPPPSPDSRSVCSGSSVSAHPAPAHQPRCGRESA